MNPSDIIEAQHHHIEALKRRVRELETLDTSASFPQAHRAVGSELLRLIQMLRSESGWIEEVSSYIPRQLRSLINRLECSDD